MTDSKVKKSGLEFEVPEGWEVVKLKDVAKITSGSTPLRSNLEYHKGGTIPWVKTTDLNNGEITLTEEKITPKALKETSLRLYPVGTVLVAMYGGFNQIGRTGILGIEATINQALSALSVKSDEVDPNFLISWLNAKVGEWKKLAGSSRKDPNITSKDVGDFPFFLIPLPEQQAIAQVLGTIDQAIQTTERLIAQKELRKKWLMQNLLTGKIRLKGFSGEWREASISDFGLVQTGNTPSKLDSGNWGGEYNWCTADDMKSKYVSNTLQKLSGKGWETARIAKANSVLVTCIASIGVNAITKVDTGFNQQINSITPSENYDVEFIYYLMVFSKNKLMEYAGAGALPMLNKNTFMSIKFKIPPIGEQSAVSQVLKTADQEINLLKTKAEKLREQKKGMMQVLLTGKVRVKELKN